MLYRGHILFLFLFTFSYAYAQESNIAIGTWRVHLPYYYMKTIAVADSKIYAANGSSIFYFDKEDNSVNVLSKYTGLHDIMVSKLGYNASQGTLIIGYESGNLDLIRGNAVTNVNDIFRAGFTGSKKINHFHMSDEFAYISGDYGLTVYDLKKNEVKESYLTLAPNSSSNAVYASTLTSDKDSIFLATSKGVMAAKVSQAVNLLDYSNWYTFKIADSIDTVNVVAVAALNGMVYAAVQKKGIYYYNGSKWKKTSLPMTGGGSIKSLIRSGQVLLACVDSAVFQITTPTSWSVLLQQNNSTPWEAYVEVDNTQWIATSGGGITRHKNNVLDVIYPNGTFVNRVFKFGYYQNNLIALAGGYNALAQRTYAGNWHSIFENNTSWVVGMYKYPDVPNYFRDFISATYNEKNSTLYLSSFGEGFVAVGPDKATTVFTNANSPLKRTGILQDGDLLIGETATDQDGYLWVPNTAVSAGLANLHKLSSAGAWTSYKLSSTIAKNIVGVTIDDFDTKWLKAIGVSETGIVVFNEKKNLTRTLTNSVGQGKLPDSKINCITKDKKGAIYVGTGTGIAICYDPSNIFANGVDLVTPIFEGFPILYERDVLAIEVDGGNRKWVGTNNGLWLFNEDMTKVLLYFNKDNSPLLSDYIYDIKVHPLSGEVFFATEQGLISYRGTATEGDKEFSDVKIFPNPVNPDFTGLVGISGLASDVVVKITDVAGNLVYETKAQGGTAVWNVKDYNGKRAATGVYLIFCASSKEGSSKFVSKIAVVE